MFAPITSQQQVASGPSNDTKPATSIKTPLSLAIGMALSLVALQTHAAPTEQSYNELAVTDVNVNAEVNDSSAITYQTMEDSDRLERDRAFIVRQTELFLECQELQSSPTRLACYDKVAEQGKASTYITQKQPLDLVKTIKTTIAGNPQVILADEETPINGQTSSNGRLDTVGLTEREAKVLEDVGVTQTDIEKYTPLSLAFDLDQNSDRGTWTVRPYKSNYILPLFYSFDQNLSPTSSDPFEPGAQYTSNDIRSTELKFQLSLKTKVAEDLFNTRADLWFGYTQQAHWQVYNEDNSRPFRGTDYQPELFLTQPVTADLPFGGRLRMLGAGAVHHSNGRSDPISRSWNRAYLMAGAEWDKLTIVPRLWKRINNESDSSEDNPDIEDYMGYGDIQFLYDLPNQQSLSGTLRYNLNTNKGAAQIDYVYPLTQNINGYLQLFHGYGESIIDYNHENTAVGIGIVLNDWKGF